MTFQDLAVSRITPKLSNGNNYKNLVRFTNSIFDKTISDIQLIKDLKNLNSDSTIVLNELGKLLGAFPRPILEIGTSGDGFVAWDISKWDTIPFFTVGSEDIRPLTNMEYSRLLKAVATLNAFNGTVDDWSSLIGSLADSSVYIVNKPSAYDIIILKDLTDFEKNLLEFLLSQIDNLTVSRDFLGTSSSGQPLQWDITPWDTVSFINPW